VVTDEAVTAGEARPGLLTEQTLGGRFAQALNFLQADLAEDAVGAEVVLARRLQRLEGHVDTESAGQGLGVLLSVLAPYLPPVALAESVLDQPFVVSAAGLRVAEHLLQGDIQLAVVQGAEETGEGDGGQHPWPSSKG